MYFWNDRDELLKERDALRAELEKVHALLRAWRATVSIERDSRGENPVIATMVHNNQGRELNAAGVAMAEYVDSLDKE